MIQRNKIRLGRNSQAGQEATNLVGQLQEEFVNTTKGFKNVLQVRSDRMKEKTDRETNFHKTSKEEEGERISLLGNKPKIYQESQDTGKLSSGLSSFGGVEFNNGGGLNLTEAASSGPRLDLTSAILQNQGGSSMKSGESATQLPRPYGIRQTENNFGDNTGMRLRHSQSSVSNNDTLPTTSLPVYTPLDIQRMEEQSGQSQMMQLIPDQNYLRERADAMETVESNIVELGTIFNKLAVMVNEHSEMVQRVEDNVDSANDNLTLSLNTLTDTLDNLRSNKQLFFRMMAVLVVFVIFFITFFA
jgi:syntaxin 5